MTVTPLVHIVFIGGPSPTHARAGIKFSARLTEKFPNAFISVYVLPPLVSRSNAYLMTQSETARGQIRIISPILDVQAIHPSELLSNFETSFKRWVAEELCAPGFRVGKHTVAPPTWIIEDHINGGVGLECGLPIVSFWPVTAVAMIAHFGNADHGLGGRLLDAVSAQSDRQASHKEGSLQEIFHQELSHRLVCIPGLPAFYEHEQIPQLAPPVLGFVVAAQKGWNNLRDEMDVAVINGTYEMEPIAAQACMTAFTKPLRPLCVGPSVDLPPAPPIEPDMVSEFLDKAYTELGPHSVIYMAFGTVFFPLPESAKHLEILIEEILAQGLRLVFSLSSEHAKIDESLLERLTGEGKAIFPKWTNQLNVIEHPAIHYIVSHGGWNTTTEALVRDVPIIFWPFAGDQPTNALQVATQHDCGFELTQVRTGPAKNKMYRGTTVIGTNEAVRQEVKNILEMSKGARGRQQRTNVKALGRIIRESVSKGGSGDIALGELGNLIGL